MKDLTLDQKIVKPDSSLSDYILLIEDVIDENIQKDTIEKMQKINLDSKINYDFPNPVYDDRYREIFLNKHYPSIDFLTSQFNSVKERDDHYITYPFEKIIYDSLFHYIFEYYDFNWYQKWYNFTQARLNKYETGMFMNQHCDNFRTMFDGKWKGVPIYSIIGFLNDDYEGGDLVFWDNFIIPKKAGSVVVFPSNFLYPHKVTEVTRGTRYTFSSYAF